MLRKGLSRERRRQLLASPRRASMCLASPSARASGQKCAVLALVPLLGLLLLWAAPRSSPLRRHEISAPRAVSGPSATALWLCRALGSPLSCTRLQEGLVGSSRPLISTHGLTSPCALYPVSPLTEQSVQQHPATPALPALTIGEARRASRLLCCGARHPLLAAAQARLRSCVRWMAAHA